MSPEDIRRVERFLAEEAEVEAACDTEPDAGIDNLPPDVNSTVREAMDIDDAIHVLRCYRSQLSVAFDELTPEYVEKHRQSLTAMAPWMTAIFKKFGAARLLKEDENLSSLESRYYEGVLSGEIKPSPELTTLLARVYS